MNKRGFNTSLLHDPKRENPFGATQVPIYQSSAFAHESAEELEKIFANRGAGFSYTRIGNPTVEAFENKMTMLEGGIASVAAASGMAAIANALLNVLQSGDEVAAAPGIYGGTVELFDELKVYGIRTVYAADHTAEAFDKVISDRTRVIFAESIGNPKLDVLDIRRVAAVARKHRILFIVDNTAATPFLVKPLALGADVVVHSSSKYINGSGNAISGVLTWGGKFKFDPKRYPGMQHYQKFGSFDYIAKLRNGLFRSIGAALAPQNAFLNNLGLETMGLRMERQCTNAIHLADFLQQLDDSILVNYPGLPEHPEHHLAYEQFHGYYGAIFTLRAGTKERAFRILNALKIPLQVSNIGDTRTLIIHPASTIAAHLTEEELSASGVYPDLVRVSVGIEEIEDLKEDFRQAILKA